MTARSISAIQIYSGKSMRNRLLKCLKLASGQYFNFMEIAKNITAKHFLTLDLTESENGWKEAISILQRRINERFIEATDKLIGLEDHLSAADKKYGFTILSLDCLL